MLRLKCAVAALLLVGTLILAFTAYARHQEAGGVHAAAPVVFDQKYRGVALQRAAMQAPDVLPLYGACEVIIADRFHPNAIFRGYPSGFTVFAVDERQPTCSLNVLEHLAGCGCLRGKKIVILTGPSTHVQMHGTRMEWWLSVKERRESFYNDYFSILAANELIFDGGLSLGVKQAAARRMLEYPQTVADDRLLRMALFHLKAGSPAYFLLQPLGWMQTALMELQDHWATLQALPHPPAIPRAAETIDWNLFRQRARRAVTVESSSNAFGFNNPHWANFFSDWKSLAGTSTDEQFRRALQDSPEQADLRMLLQALREMGACPLLISTPFKGVFYDYLGVSRSARQAYYDRVAEIARDYHVPCVTLPEHDGDRYFLRDEVGHLSSEGWMWINEIMDRYYHGNLQ